MEEIKVEEIQEKLEQIQNFASEIIKKYEKLQKVVAESKEEKAKSLAKKTKELEELEEKLRNIMALEKQLNLIQSPEDRKKIEKVLKKTKEKVVKAIETITKTIDKLVEKEIPDVLAATGKRILAFFKRRSPKGVKVDSKKSFFYDPTRFRFVWAYYVILRNVPKIGEKSKGTLYLVFSLCYEEEKPITSYVDVSTEYIPVSHLPLKKKYGKNWKQALLYACQRAYALGFAVIGTVKLKVDKKAFKKYGFGSVKVKVDGKRNLVEIVYPIGSNERIPKDFSRKGNKFVPSDALLDELFLAVSDATGTLEFQSDAKIARRVTLVDWEYDSDKNCFIFRYRVVPFPDFKRLR